MKKFYIGLKDKFMTIKETANGYKFTTHLEGLKANRLAIDPRNEARLYVATDEGLWKTEDSGENWARADDGITSKKVTAVAIHPNKQVNGNAIVYAGTEPSMLYYSEDNGASWTEFKGIQDMPSKEAWAFPPRPETHFVRWITPSFSEEDFLAISIEAGAVLYTNDHGKTWNDRPEKSPIDVHTLLKHPDAPARIYAANGDGSSTPHKAYAESSDGGQTWAYMSEGLEEHPYLYNLILHPNNPNERLVSASKNAGRAHRDPRYSTIYQKIGDAPWTEMAEGLPREDAYTHHLANDPTNVDAYYALNNFGLYYLGAEETKWEEIEMDWVGGQLGERPYFFVVREVQY